MTQEFSQFQDQLRLIHKVYFLQGVPIQKFVTSIFEKIEHHQYSVASLSN